MIRSGRGCGHARHGQTGKRRSVRNATDTVRRFRACVRVTFTVTLEFRIALRWEGACLAQKPLKFLAGKGQAFPNLDS